MSGHRQAAAALHALNPRDQALILAALDPADQGVLRGHIKELKSLGFDPQAMPAAAPKAAAPPARKAAGAREQLENASSASMLAVLAHEPAVLIARLLDVAPWPWTEGLLEQLPAPRRQLVREARGGEPVAAAALEQFLVDAAAAALPAAAPPAAPAAAGLKAAILARVGAWTR